MADSPAIDAPPRPRPSPRSSWYAWLPCAAILVLVGGLIAFNIPANSDRLDESYEPIKTLKFVHSRGQAFAKWPPMPCFLYAPAYAGPLLYWKMTGDLGRVSTDYPYGFARPFEQQGTLIVVARTLGLAIGLASVALFARALRRLTGSATATFLAAFLCMATSPELIYKFVATKPDGLMMAFLAMAMAIYFDILASGLTPRRGALLSCFAVASISCKELTAPAFILPYLILAAVGWSRTGGDREGRRAFLRAYGVAIATGLAAYFLINVVYAPSTWLGRMRVWLHGPGKDPAVWAASGYTTGAYLLDTARGLLMVLGPGGLAAVLASLAISAVARFPGKVAAWLPPLGFLAFVVATAGYMPPYFLVPMTVLLALPVALAFAHAGRSLLGASRGARATAAALVGVACVANLWHANLARGRAEALSSVLLEDYCRAHVAGHELIHLANLHPSPPGVTRLSYFGFNVDDRPLGALLDRPPVMPDVVLIADEQLRWMADFKNRPMRTAMMKGETGGISYDRFDGFEALGYRRVDTIRPRETWLGNPPWRHLVEDRTEYLVFRKAPAS